MKKIFCCLKGEGSRQGVQAPPAPPSQPAQPKTSENINNENDDVHKDITFGSNEFLKYARRNNMEPQDDRLPRNERQNILQAVSPLLLLKCGITFPWKDIVAGTQDFSTENYLGEGNFGEVFRCDLPEFDAVGAAKIQKLGNTSAQNEFVAEITMLHAANHPNVVQLIGKCFGDDQRVIVYEYMPQGSLDHHIYPHAKSGKGVPQEYPVLEWETRMRIAVGVAEALDYLHGTMKVIHRDVKLANVLLDANFVPKLTDFGLATKMVIDRARGEQQREISPIKGTPGCVAPETEESGLVSSKSDVYSYGIFLITLFTGRKAYDFQRPLDTRKIADWLMPVWGREENIPLVIDAALGPRYSVDGIVRLFQAAMRCINLQARDRPPMSQVLPMVRHAAAQPLRKFSPVKRRRSNV